MYLIDYDVSSELRHQFYYLLRKEIISLLLDGVKNEIDRSKKFGELKKLSLKQLLSQIEYTKSTQSVIVTSSEKLAKIIHTTALKFGKSNLYEVRKIA